MKLCTVGKKEAGFEFKNDIRHKPDARTGFLHPRQIRDCVCRFAVFAAPTGGRNRDNSKNLHSK